LRVLVEQRDRQTVELGVRALRHDLVHDLVIGMAANPVGDQLAQELALLGLGRRKHFDTSDIDHPPILVRTSLHTRHVTPPSLGRRFIAPRGLTPTVARKAIPVNTYYSSFREQSVNRNSCLESRHL